MQYEFDAIGTRWQIDLYSSLSSSKKKNLLNKIKDTIFEFDSVYSRFRQDSLITRMSRKTGIYNLPSHADFLFSLYERLY